MHIAKLAYKMPKTTRENAAMRGINYSDNITDGDLADSLNLSARRYPYLSTRQGRKELDGYQGATALTAWDKLVAVVGTNLLYDGKVVGTVTAGEKQFAMVNTRLVIWPDKVYLDLNTKSIKALGYKTTATKAAMTSTSITLTGADLSGFVPGDTVTLSGTGQDKDFNIRSIDGSKITVTDKTFTDGSYTAAITLERKVPDLDYICESDNRMYGCRSEDQTIYVSALGDPTNFYVYEGVTTDSYSLAVGSSGKFTGCCKLGSSVLFWKEDRLHKLLGSYPAEYQLSTYEMEGLRDGCNKSLQVINETLYYMGLHGVYAYAGGLPQLISANFGNREFTDAVGGNDGDTYYLSVKEGETSHLFAYELKYSLWIREGAEYASAFARSGRVCYMLTGGTVWQMDAADNKNLVWYARCCPTYGTYTTSRSTSQVMGRKRYDRLILRLELPKGSFVKARAKMDGRPWKTIGTVVGGKTDVVTMRMALKRCDKFELELSGQGPCTILSMQREFHVGSEV